jgi:hypothetical protein
LSEDPGRTVCLYCNSIVRIQPDGPQPAFLENTLVEADMQAIKQLLLDGRREDATHRYLETTGAGEAAARETIQELERLVSVDVMRNQQLTSRDIWYVGLYCVIFLAAVVTGVTGQIHPLLALALVAFTAWQLFVLSPSIRLWLRFRQAISAPATILKAAPLGKVKTRLGRGHALQLLAEVHPPAGTPYRVELLLPVKETALGQVQPGSQFHVKYLPEDPQQIVFDQ